MDRNIIRIFEISLQDYCTYEDNNFFIREHLKNSEDLRDFYKLIQTTLSLSRMMKTSSVDMRQAFYDVLNTIIPLSESPNFKLKGLLKRSLSSEKRADALSKFEELNTIGLRSETNSDFLIKLKNIFGGHLALHDESRVQGWKKETTKDFMKLFNTIRHDPLPRSKRHKLCL